MQIDFEREKEWWNGKSDSEEQDRADEAINRLLRWREIEKNLEGVQTILDVGAATGAFSIPLARWGYEVTHLDFAPRMLEIARRKAERVPNIRFVEANAADLSRFADRSFDLVLNMDGAISFCGAEAEQALAESCRVTGQKLITAVSHRAWMVPVWITSSLSELGRFAPAVYTMLSHGAWHYDQYPENAQLAPGYLGALRAFLPDELRLLIESNGMRVQRCGGLGSLSNLCGPETVEMVLKNDDLLKRFLDLCERFDGEILPAGPGTRQRAGLIAVAERG